MNGGAGTDTLTINDIAGAAADLSLLSVSNVENLVLTSTSSLDNGAADVSGWTGLTSAKFDLRNVAADQAVTAADTTAVEVTAKVTTAAALTVNGGSTVSASVNNTVDNSAKTITVLGGAATSAVTVAQTAATAAHASKVTITDKNAGDDTKADTITTVTLSGLKGGVAAINSDALATLNLSSSDKNVTIDNDTADHALTLNLNGVTGGTLTDGEATTLIVNTSGAAVSGVTLTAVKATGVTVNAAVATTIADVNITAAKSLTVTGAGATTVTATTDVTALASIDASGSTGGLTVTPALATGVAFTGSSATDTIKIGATTKSISMGAGDDSVTVVAVSALGTGGSVDAGEGTDTLVFSTYANAVTASGTTTFEGTVSGFERLELSGVNSAAAAAVNLSNLDDINYVTLSATNTETTTISNFGANGTIVFKASQTTAKPVTVSLKDDTGSSDVLNVVLSKDTATALVGLTAAGVETINVTSTETATTLLGTVTHGVEALVIADATALNISGNAGVTITTLTGTKLASIDASGVTTGLVSLTTGALTTAATIKGGAGANTIVATAATKAVTYTGQDKVDTITINNALNNVVSTAGGNDVIVTGSGADTINGGAGDDNITSGAGLDQITGGGGNDTFVLTNNSSGTIFATISDATAGDVIQVANKGTEVSFNGGATLGAKITLSSLATFTDYLNAAAAGDGSTNGIWAWFQFNGNTYLVSDQGAGATFAAGTDFLVELTGLVDLTNSTGVGGNGITIV